VQAYNPYTNEWKIVASLPEALVESAAVVVYGLPFMEGDSDTGTTNQYLRIIPTIP